MSSVVRPRAGGILIVGALLFAACSSDATGTTTTSGSADSSVGATTAVATTESPAPDDSLEAVTSSTSTTAVPVTEAPTTTEPGPVPADEATLAAVTEALASEPRGCDPLDTRQCLLPFPSNAYRVDGRVAFPADGMPVNASGVAIDPSEWNRNDGFSPNTPILTHIAGLDAAASKLPPWTDLDAPLTADATVVLVDVDNGERIPLWAELDAKATSDDDRLLEIHPAVALREGHTYAVGLRGMADASGVAIEPSAVFRVYRDGLATEIDAIEARRPEMEQILTALTTAGIDRGSLQLAWDFTVATKENISGRMLAIRDQALAQLGDATPAFQVDEVTKNPDENIALQIEGTFTVPNYLTGDGGPGNRFFYGGDVDLATQPDALPIQSYSVTSKGNVVLSTIEAPFVCNISVTTMEGTEPAHLVQYGHGLLGSHHEISAGNVRAFANEHNVVFCATKWAGMSEDDIGNAAATLGDFSQFATIADRLQQGVLNQIFLGRLMTGIDGLITRKEFLREDGTPMIDTAHLDYDGNSQGGIMGLMLTAVSPDIERSVLGVTGINYSLLLSRSVDFATYEAIFAPAYPNDLDRDLILAFTQMLWDRGEGAGYVQHVTDDPYEGTAAKNVLLDVAFGDWQVSELTAMIAARTMGVPIHRPVTAEGRSREVVPGWGLADLVHPSSGSGLIIWDSGSDPIPFDNVPPSTSRDPHEDPRADADVRRQKAAFLFDDTLIDVCGGGPCTADSTG